MFQIIERNRIRQTRDNDSLGVLVEWIIELAGDDEAMEVQSWSELAYPGDYYEGPNFKVLCID